MLKKNLFFLIFTSIATHLFFSFNFPLIRDELNLWNMYYNGQNFHEFWQNFIKYDTQQPLFHLLWYPFFNEDLSVMFLRLPSIFLFFLGSAYLWEKLFPYEQVENKLPWLLFLFTPFLTIYSTFFLPYSLLILTSLFNFHQFNKLNESASVKNIILFFVSSVLVTFTHYFGALQAILLCLYFIYHSKNIRLKLILSGLTIAVVTLVLTASDFLNDFSSRYSTNKTPGIKDVLGDLNLLIGGKYIAAILLVLLILKKNFSFFKSKEFVFIVTVVCIAYLKSIFFSPSFEARYFLILIYPLYKLTCGLQVKWITPVMIVVSLFSLYILQNSFSPTFAIDYRKIPKTGLYVGFLTGPCPKFYFREFNYRCKGHLQSRIELLDNNQSMIIDQVNFPYFKKMIPDASCRPMDQGLTFCVLPLNNQL